MGWFNDWAPTVARGVADMMTFGMNEFAGNPVGTAAENLLNPQDPNAASNAQQMQLAHENMDMQREFAKNGVRWRVEDAVAAGLHPLAALGVNPASASPVSANVFPADTAKRDTVLHTLSGMSQDMLRARLSRATEEERQSNAAMRLKTIAEADQAHSAAELNRGQLATLNLPPPTPSMYRAYRDHKGNIQYAYDSSYAMGLSGNPLAMWAMSVRDTFGGPSAQNFGGSIQPRESTSTWKWGGR